MQAVVEAKQFSRFNMALTELQSISHHRDGDPDVLEFIKAQMARERSGFARDAFHDVAIAAERIHLEIEDFEAGLIEIGGKPFARHGHADAVARALAQGRIPLPQAAGHFRDWSNDQPGFWPAVESFSPSGTEGEKLCRYVIGWTEGILGESPETARAIGERLRSELDELRRTGILPPAR